MTSDGNGMDEVVEKLVRKDKPSIEICKCGHPEDTHGAGAEHGAGETECVLIKPGARTGWLCGCEGFDPVLVVSTAFPFYKGTYGDGQEHNLIGSIIQLVQAGGSFNWIGEGPQCSECGVGWVPPYPKRTDSKSWGVGVGPTVFFCREHYDGLELE